MLALLTFLMVIVFSMVVIKIGTIALETTGLSKEIASFQSMSAFSGVGFTTMESEMLMSNYSRRKIIKVLMLMGSAGLTSAIATLILAFMNARGVVSILGYQMSTFLFTVITIAGSLLILFLVYKTDIFDNLVRYALKRPLNLMRKKMSLYDYEKILGLSKGNSIVSFEVPRRNWMVNKTIGTLKLQKEGIIVLGVFRTIHGQEEYIETPSDDFKIAFKDKLVVYAKEEVAEGLAKREKGRQGSVDRKEAEKIHKTLSTIKQIHEEKVSEAIKRKPIQK